MNATISQITVAGIIDIVSDFYDVPVNDILSERRTQTVVWPRQMGMYLAKRHTTLSYPNIAQRFGGRDHTTAMHAVRKVEKRRREHIRVAGEIAHIEILIEAERRARLHFGLAPESDVDPVIVAERVLTQARGEFSVSAREVIALAQAVYATGQQAGDPLGALDRLLVSVETFARTATAAAGARNGEERILTGEARNRAFAELLQTTNEIRKEFPDATAG